MSSEAKIAANRENAQKSSGPVSAEGKAKSSLNAVKTGLTARTVVLSPEDAPIYQKHIERIYEQFAPQNDEQKDLVQAIADNLWRVRSIPSLESGIYALGRREFANEFNDEPDAGIRETLVRAKIFSAYRRDLSNLALQERRLTNQLEKDQSKLKQLQTEYESIRREQMQSAIEALKVAEQKALPFDPKFLGFVFSIQEVIDEMACKKARAYMRGQNSSMNPTEFESIYQSWKERQAA